MLVDLRFQNPGPELDYDRIEVHRVDGVEIILADCPAGATCTIGADLPVGTHEVWLIAWSGPYVSAESNHREIIVPEPASGLGTLLGVLYLIWLKWRRK